MIWLDLTLALLAASFLVAFLRVLKGPSVADRAVAADVGLYTLVAAIALLAVRAGSDVFIDIVVIATLLGFLATVALAALVGRRNP